MATTTDRPLPRRKAQSVYSNAVLKYGRDSAEAKAAGCEFYCIRHCSDLIDTLSVHDLTDEQRQRIVNVVLTVGRQQEITVRLDDGTLHTGTPFGTPQEPN